MVRLTLLLTFFFCLPSITIAQWSEYKEVDKITGLKVHRVSMSASENERFNFDNKHLSLKCNENGPIQLYIDWGVYLGSKNIPVEYRIDSKAAESVVSSASTDGTATFLPMRTSITQPSIVEQMIAGSYLVARASDYRGTPTKTATFSLQGFTRAYRSACSFHSQYSDHIDSPENRANRNSILEANQARYSSGIARKIKRRWRRPIGISGTCKVEIEQSNAGVVLSISPVDCGEETGSFYQSAVKAVESAGRLPLAPSSAEFQSIIRITFQ